VGAEAGKFRTKGKGESGGREGERSNKKHKPSNRTSEAQTINVFLVRSSLLLCLLGHILHWLDGLTGVIWVIYYTS